MIAKNLLIVDGPPELDMLYSLPRDGIVVTFKVRRMFGQHFETEVQVVIGGWQALNKVKKSILVSGKIISVSHERHFPEEIRVGYYFIAKYDYFSRRSGTISFSPKPQGIIQSDIYPCRINFGQDYLELLKASCQDYVDKDIYQIDESVKNFNDYGIPVFDIPKSGIHEIQFRLTLPHEALVKKDENFGMSWRSDDLRPATRLEHIAFSVRYPEEQRLFNILCFGSAAYVLASGWKFLYLHENDRLNRCLSLVNILDRFPAEDHWRVLAVSTKDN